MWISQELTQENTQERLDEVLQTIKTECEEGGHQLTLYADDILSRVLTDVHIMRNQSDADGLHPIVVFERMDLQLLIKHKCLSSFADKVQCSFLIASGRLFEFSTRLAGVDGAIYT